MRSGRGMDVAAIDPSGSPRRKARNTITDENEVQEEGEGLRREVVLANPVDDREEPDREPDPPPITCKVRAVRSVAPSTFAMTIANGAQVAMLHDVRCSDEYLERRRASEEPGQLWYTGRLSTPVSTAACRVM